MTSSDWFKWSVIVLLISAAIQALTGIALFFSLLVSRPALLESVSEVHEYNGLVMAVLVIIHISFNWGWIKNHILVKK